MDIRYKRKSGFFRFYNLNTINMGVFEIFFANIEIYVNDLAEDEFNTLKSYNNTKFKYDQIPWIENIQGFLTGYARRIDFMAYGNTNGWVDPNQYENNQIYEIYEGYLVRGYAQEDPPLYGRLFTQDECRVGYFSSKG